MELILGITIPVTPATLVFILLVGLFAGLVKGLVGFGMPMIIISGVSSVISPELALATLILPTLISNGVQALRQGMQAAVASVVAFRRFLIAGFVMLLISAQFVLWLPQSVLLAVIGVPVTFFAAIQLAGRPLRFSATSKPVELGIGAVAGTMGGLSGIWGLRAETAPLSVLMVVPALIGISLGNRVQDRIDQAMFRTITLWVLLIAGLNLLRRAVF